MGNGHTTDLSAVLAAISDIPTEIYQGEIIVPASAGLIDTLTESDQTITLQSITIPSFIDNIVFAYLELRCHVVKDTSTAYNYGIATGNIEVQDPADPGFITAITPRGTLFAVAADQIRNVSDVLGKHDIKAVITSGGTLNCRWVDIKAFGADLVVYGLQPILHLVMSKT